MVSGEDEVYIRAIVEQIDRVRDGRTLDISPGDTSLRRAIWRRVGPGSLIEVRYPDRTPALTLEQLAPFPDQHFDLIFGCFLVPPAQDPEELVALCKRVLKSGGRFLLDIPVLPDGADTGPADGGIHTPGRWRQALENERLWVDRATRRTPDPADVEYMGDAHTRRGPSRTGAADQGPDRLGCGQAPAGIDRAIPPDHWYLTVSGLK